MSSNLKLTKIDQTWLVWQDAKLVAEIYLDYLHQVDEVVLYSELSQKDQLKVLRLAASHVQQYIKERRPLVFGRLNISGQEDKKLTEADSRRLMSFRKIPTDIRTLDRETVERVFCHHSINVIIATHQTPKDAIDAALFQVNVEGLRCTIGSRRGFYSDSVNLRFTVNKPNHFIFWQSESLPTGSGFDLYIIPDYHPVMKGWKSVGMVNGSTDTYIRGKAIQGIYCPKASRADRHGKCFGTSWNHVRHPFYAIGRSVDICIRARSLRSKEGVEELVQLLRAALGFGNQYVSISGGFRPPMRYSHNRLLETNQRSPYPDANYTSRTGNTVRGSEGDCVWAYRTLEAEGVLVKAHIPSWFLPEGWLKIYEGAEVRHGLF